MVIVNVDDVKTCISFMYTFYNQILNCSKLFNKEINLQCVEATYNL